MENWLEYISNALTGIQHALERIATALEERDQ
jgi:hypothetical protein